MKSFLDTDIFYTFPFLIIFIGAFLFIRSMFRIAFSAIVVVPLCFFFGGPAVVPKKLYLLKCPPPVEWPETPVNKRTRGPHFGNRRGTGGEPGQNRPRAGRRSLPVAPPLLADGVLRTHKAWLVGKTRGVAF